MAPTASIPLGDTTTPVAPSKIPFAKEIAQTVKIGQQLGNTASNVIKASTDSPKLSSKQTIDLEAKHGAHK